MKGTSAMGAISSGIILALGINPVLPTSTTPPQQHRTERSAFAAEMMPQAPAERVTRVQAKLHRDAHLEAPLMVRPDSTTPVAVRGATCKRADLEWPTWRDNVLVSNPGTDFFELRADGRDELLEVLGCADSGYECPPDEVMVFHSTGNTKVLIAFIKQGCVTRAKQISTEDYMSYVTGGHTVELRKFQTKQWSEGTSPGHQWNRNKTLAGDTRALPETRPQTIRLSRFCQPLAIGLARDAEWTGFSRPAAHAR